MDRMQTGKFRWFRNQRIQNKIIFVYLPLIVIPLLLLGLFSYNTNTNSIVSKTRKNMLDESRLITTRIDTLLVNAESFANIAMLDLNKEVKLKTLELAAKHEGELPISDDHVLRNQIENKLDFAQLIFHDVESAVFVDRNQNVYTTDPKLTAGSETGLASDMYRKVEGSNGIMLWFPMQKRSFWVLDQDKAVLTVGKKILDTETMETLGYLFVNINEKTLSNIYNPVGPVQTAGYYIVDSRGIVISAGDENRILKPLESYRKQEIMAGDTVFQEIRKEDGEKVLLTAMPFSHADWKLVDEISLADLTRETAKVSRVILIVGSLCLLLALLGAIILSGVIAAPIMSLAKHMNRIRDENIDRPVEVRSRDEVGMLGAGLNMMLGRINDLLVKVREEQQQKREYELALIQEQIKPHFFYNTLDLIFVMCKTGESEEAGKATKALADFYRVALSNGKEIITVREELQNLQSYLYIQSARYSDLFDFRIDVPAELQNCAIPKLTLQPLVENSIYHGLKEKGSFGHISIEGRRQEEMIELIVRDDGVGFSPEQLEGFRKGRESSGTFGLKSVDERIRLYFDDRYGIRIHSTRGEGAEITVRIPLSRGEQADV